MWIHKRQENSITLTIVTGQKLKHKRIIESVQAKKGFWTHHILIGHQKEINNDLQDLIKASYEFYIERKTLKDSKTKPKGKPFKNVHSQN